MLPLRGAGAQAQFEEEQRSGATPLARTQSAPPTACSTDSQQNEEEATDLISPLGGASPRDSSVLSPVTPRMARSRSKKSALQSLVPTISKQDVASLSRRMADTALRVLHVRGLEGQLEQKHAMQRLFEVVRQPLRLRCHWPATLMAVVFLTARRGRADRGHIRPVSL